MSVQDLHLTCFIRRVFSRHWIDADRLSYSARAGHVHLSGEIRVLGAQQGEPANTVIALQALDTEIRQQQGVKSVRFELTNWVRDDSGQWVCLDKDSRSPTPMPRTLVEEPKMLDLTGQVVITRPEDSGDRRP